MIIYLVEYFPLGNKAFVDKQLAEAYVEKKKSNNHLFTYSTIKEIELITDEFMELTLQQPKPPKEFT